MGVTSSRTKQKFTVNPVPKRSRSILRTTSSNNGDAKMKKDINYISSALKTRCLDMKELKKLRNRLDHIRKKQTKSQDIKIKEIITKVDNELLEEELKFANVTFKTYKKEIEIAKKAQDLNKIQQLANDLKILHKYIVSLNISEVAAHPRKDTLRREVESTFKKLQQFEDKQENKSDNSENPTPKTEKPATSAAVNDQIRSRNGKLIADIFVEIESKLNDLEQRTSTFVGSETSEEFFELDEGLMKQTLILDDLKFSRDSNLHKKKKELLRKIANLNDTLDQRAQETVKAAKTETSDKQNV